MKERAPAFQLYASDWLSSLTTRTMTLEERGAYVDLLCHAWLSGGIPADDQDIARLLGGGLRTWKRLKVRIDPCFSVVDGAKRRNPKQEEVRAARQSFRDRGARGGKQAASKRVAESAVLLGQNPPAIDHPSFSSSSSSSTDNASDADDHLARAGHFCQRYRFDWYPQYQKVAYVVSVPTEQRDLASAIRLAMAYTDPQLAHMAATFLQIPPDKERFLANKTRTITMLVGFAPELAKRLGYVAGRSSA